MSVGRGEISKEVEVTVRAEGYRTTVTAKGTNPDAVLVAAESVISSARRQSTEVPTQKPGAGALEPTKQGEWNPPYWMSW